MIFFLVLVPFYAGVDIDNIYWTLITLGCACDLLIMPLIICFALKKKDSKKSGKKTSVKNGNGLKFHDNELDNDQSNINQGPNDHHCDEENDVRAATEVEKYEGNPQYDLARNGQDNAAVNKKEKGLDKECKLSADSSTDQSCGIGPSTSQGNSICPISQPIDLTNESQSFSLQKKNESSKEMPSIEV